MKRRMAGIALVALGACRTLGLSRPEERWETVRVTSIEADDLWTVVNAAVIQAGFRRLEFDRLAGTGTTGWLVSLFPYSGKGWRERAHAKLERDGESAWKVSIRVERETNEAVKRPLDEAEAEWEWDDDNADRARLVAARIAASLGLSGGSGTRR